MCTTPLHPDGLTIFRLKIKKMMKLGLIFERYRHLGSSRNLKEPGDKNRVFDLGTIAN